MWDDVESLVAIEMRRRACSRADALGHLVAELDHLLEREHATDAARATWSAARAELATLAALEA